jgi:hypothetical protein
VEDKLEIAVGKDGEILGQPQTQALGVRVEFRVQVRTNITGSVLRGQVTVRYGLWSKVKQTHLGTRHSGPRVAKALQCVPDKSVPFQTVASNTPRSRAAVELGEITCATYIAKRVAHFCVMESEPALAAAG